MLIGDSVLSESGARDLLSLGKQQENVKIGKTGLSKNKTESPLRHKAGQEGRGEILLENSFMR